MNSPNYMPVIISDPTLNGLYYFLVDTIYINTDHPKAAETSARCPQLPVVNGNALKLITELMQSKATAEAKVKLLKLAVNEL
jgi:hypothetical protein